MFTTTCHWSLSLARQVYSTPQTSTPPLSSHLSLILPCSSCFLVYQKYFVHTVHTIHVHYMPHPWQPLFVYHTSNTGCRVHITQLLIMQFSPSSSLRSKYSQYSILRNPQIYVLYQCTIIVLNMITVALQLDFLHCLLKITYSKNKTPDRLALFAITDRLFCWAQVLFISMHRNNLYGWILVGTATMTNQKVGVQMTAINLWQVKYACITVMFLLVLFSISLMFF